MDRSTCQVPHRFASPTTAIGLAVWLGGGRRDLPN